MNALIAFASGLVFFVLGAMVATDGPGGAQGTILTLAAVFVGLMLCGPATYLLWQYDLKYWSNWRKG